MKEQLQKHISKKRTQGQKATIASASKALGIKKENVYDIAFQANISIQNGWACDDYKDKVKGFWKLGL